MVLEQRSSGLKGCWCIMISLFFISFHLPWGCLGALLPSPLFPAVHHGDTKQGCPHRTPGRTDKTLSRAVLGRPWMISYHSQISTKYPDSQDVWIPLAETGSGPVIPVGWIAVDRLYVWFVYLGACIYGSASAVLRMVCLGMSRHKFSDI